MAGATLTSALGWIAAAAGTWSALMQNVRLRCRGTQGVSLTTWTLLGALAVFWVLYGVAVRSWPLALSSALTLPFQTMIWWRLRPRARIGAVVGSAGAVLACCLVPGLLWGWSGAVVGAGGAGIASRLPQLGRLVRVRSTAGVSTGSWALAGAVSVMWVVYYARSRLWAVLVVTAVAGTLSLAIAVVSQWRQRRTPVTVASGSRGVGVEPAT